MDRARRTLAQKAELDELPLNTTAEHQPLTTLDIAASIEEAKPAQDQRVVTVANPAPALVPVPLNAESPVQYDQSQQASVENKVDGELEDIWSKLIAEIRAG